MSDTIRKSAVRDALSGKRVSNEIYEELEEEVQYLLEQAEERAEANGRETVMARDI